MLGRGNRFCRSSDTTYTVRREGIDIPRLAIRTPSVRRWKCCRGRVSDKARRSRITHSRLRMGQLAIGAKWVANQKLRNDRLCEIALMIQFLRRAIPSFEMIH
jgi:hypothetical protein